MKKVRIIFILLYLVCLISLITSAQTPSWIWAKRAGGIHDDYGYRLAMDASGNVYAGGIFNSDSITFDTITLIKKSFFEDAYIVKYDNNGNVLWAKDLGVPMTGEDFTYSLCNSISTDANGNCIVAGSFHGLAMHIGTTVIYNTTASAYNAYIIKFNPNGEVVWAHCPGVTNSADFISVSTDSNGNSYVTGDFNTDSIAFGSITVRGTVSGGGRHGGIFIAKYNSDGNAVWASCFGKTGFDQATSISADPEGNSYLCGHMEGPALTLGTITVSNNAYLGGIFIAKFDAGGHVVWAQSATETGQGGGQSNSICADASSNVYLTGCFTSPTITFGSKVLTRISGLPYNQPYFVKFNSGGEPLWVISAGQPNITSDKIISLDTHGNSYIAGNDSADKSNFVDKFDEAGNRVWFVRGYYDSGCYGVCVDAMGNCIITGYFTSTKIYFNSITLSNAITNASNSADFFIAKFGISLTGISDHTNPTGLINVFPSVASDKVTIENFKPIETVTLSIFNAKGQLIINQSLSEGTSDLDISDFARGIYFLRFVTPKGIVSKKIIKQ